MMMSDEMTYVFLTISSEQKRERNNFAVKLYQVSQIKYEEKVISRKRKPKKKKTKNHQQQQILKNKLQQEAIMQFYMFL